MDMTDARVLIAEMQKDVNFIKESVKRLELTMEEMKETYVTKQEFGPVKGIAYGLVSAVLMTILGLLVQHVFTK